MILDNKNSSTTDLPASLRSSLSRVFFILLLSAVGGVSAQTKPKLSGWSVNTKDKEPSAESIVLSSQTEAAGSITVEDKTPAQLPTVDLANVDDAQPPTFIEESSTSIEESPTFIEGSPTSIEESPTFIEESPTFIEESPAVKSLPKVRNIAGSENAKTASIDLIAQKPTSKPSIPSRQSVDRNLEFKETLDRQLQAIQKLGETEDSFNEQFGELYLAYARSLLKVGRLDDARKMFANALHNAKINNGVTSLEQRPVLRELFTMNLSIGNGEEAEKQLKRLVWLGSAIPEDTYSFDMVMQLGHYYLDQYLMAPRVTEDSLVGLYKSIRYYSYLIRRYSNVPDMNLALPYGDVAYAHFLKTQVRTNVDDDVYLNARKRSFLGLDKHDTRTSIDHSYSDSNRYFRLAFKKAVKELDDDATIQALMNIGDLHLLYGNPLNANIFYQRARETAEKLPEPHPILATFSQPVELPAFKLSVERELLSYGHSYQVVPMLLDVSTNGYIGGVSRQPDVNIPMSMRIRAKNAAKNLRFRPVIENDRLVSVDDYHYDVKVRIRKYSSVANTEPEK